MKKWIEENKEFLAGSASLVVIAEFLGVRSFIGSKIMIFYDNLNQVLSPAGSILVLFATIGFYLLGMWDIYKEYRVRNHD